MCAVSDLAAQEYGEDLPLAPALLELGDIDQARRWALSGGDDYELCFTVPESHMAEVGLLIARGELRATVVGHMVTGEIGRASCREAGEGGGDAGTARRRR